jgi:predicted phosphoribosyltransferase
MAANAVTRIFRDRPEAGSRLAQRLTRYADCDAIVLALPRGGVPVAFEVAKALNAPLDVFLVRKLGVPGHEELAFGALAMGGVRVLNDEVVAARHITDVVIDAVTRQQQQELRLQQRAYRGVRPPPAVLGRTVILIDDGLATGSTMRAAVRAIRNRGAKHIVVAVPAASSETCEELTDEADEVICDVTPEPFRAVGVWYRDFSPISDDEVRNLLERADREQSQRMSAC